MQSVRSDFFPGRRSCPLCDGGQPWFSCSKKSSKSFSLVDPRKTAVRKGHSHSLKMRFAACLWVVLSGEDF